METNHSEIKRYKDINLVAIDYLFQKTVGHFKWDDFDPAIPRCEKLKLKTEKLYLSKNLKGLERLLGDITKERQQIGDLTFESYIKEKTGYEIDVFEDLNNPANRRNTSDNDNYYRRQLYETYSPDLKHRLIVSESGISVDSAMTGVFLHSEKGGASVYTANGINLDINVHWRDNNCIVIKTKEIYEVVSRKIKRLQIFDNVFKIDLIEN
jgi:hypothetical protein